MHGLPPSFCRFFLRTGAFVSSAVVEFPFWEVFTSRLGPTLIERQNCSPLVPNFTTFQGTLGQVSQNVLYA